MVAYDAGEIEVVEVGPRDGFQGIVEFIPTETKADIIKRLARAGLRRIEIGSFVNPKVVPQLADTPAILAGALKISALTAQVLVPNERYGRTAMANDARMMAFVLSVSESHNRNNLRVDTSQSVKSYQQLVDSVPAGVRLRLNIATAFDCPFEGRIDATRVLALLDELVAIRPDVELCLCDTTGRATPDQVQGLFRLARERFPEVGAWAMHAHDTYGLGLANVAAAWQTGIRVFDASIGGLGGCPFAPGATGNVATEDVAWMFRRMGVRTGIDVEALVPIAADAASIFGAKTGGRVRDALLAARSGPVVCAT